MAADLRAMTDARDARDRALIVAGRFDELVAAYYEHVIVQRCKLLLGRAREQAAYDVAHDVVLRLLRQLVAGKRYGVPFRVVVGKRVDWQVKTYFAAQKRQLERTAGALREDQEPWGDDPYLDILDRDEVERLIDGLPERDREILELVYLKGLSIAQAAKRLGISRNGADQRLHRARNRLRERLDA